MVPGIPLLSLNDSYALFLKLIAEGVHDRQSLMARGVRGVTIRGHRKEIRELKLNILKADTTRVSTEMWECLQSIRDYYHF
jgi:hypothetical protein